MDQAMLGMPSREYYLTETDSEYKAAYLRYMINVAKLFNADEDAAVRDMREVLDFEEQLANVSFTFLSFTSWADVVVYKQVALNQVWRIQHKNYRW